MRNIAILLFILVLIGILWLGTGAGSFSEDEYVAPEYVEMSLMTGEDIDLEFLKEEFVPAYEF